MLTLKTEWGKKIITTEIITSVCASGHLCVCVVMVKVRVRIHEITTTPLKSVCV